MSALALKALAAANAAGVAVILDGDGLILDPTPPAGILALLRTVKPDLLRVLAGRVAARAIINTAEPPPDCSPQRWEVARRGLRRFMTDGWSDQAALLGWTLEELYAVPPVWPRVQLCGAALLIADRRVVAVTEATITTVGVTGSHLKFYRAPRVHVAQDVKAEDVKAEDVADVVGLAVPAAGTVDNAACMQISIQARPEPACPEITAPEVTGVPFYEFFCGSGMARAGLGPQWQCWFANDVSATKASSYTRNWGRDGFRLGDVARLTSADLPGHAALAWASFPCPDLSEGGQGEGLQGARSNTLWPSLALLRALRAEGRAPKTIALENVNGLVEPRGEAFFDLLCATLTDMGYRFGVLAIDAELFVPQSRPRIFVIAVDAAIAIPASLVAAGPAAPFHSLNLVKACQRNARHAPIWWRLPAPPPRNVTLADIIADAPTGVSWRSKGDTDRLLAMMAPLHLAKVEAAQRASLSSGKRMVGGYCKRMRPGEGGSDKSGDRVQRVEIRFDDVAGCLRMASGGGSSIQDIMVIDGDTVRTRRLSSREAARLMGLPDSYRLPSDYVAAYDLMGDGVAVPAVRWLAEHILEPIHREPWRLERIHAEREELDG
jgi:DNA (cytosine-5)-methyltransferase 1